MPVAQIPGTDEAIHQAAQQGWTAVLVCVTFLFTLAGVAWLIRQMFREKGQLAERLNKVEDFQRDEIVKLHVKTEAAAAAATSACHENTRTMDRLTTAIENMPCPLKNGGALTK